MTNAKALSIQFSSINLQSEMIKSQGEDIVRVLTQGLEVQNKSIEGLETIIRLGEHLEAEKIRQAEGMNQYWSLGNWKVWCECEFFSFPSSKTQIDLAGVSPLSSLDLFNHLFLLGFDNRKTRDR
jgi:hypothetical protein